MTDFNRKIETAARNIGALLGTIDALKASLIEAETNTAELLKIASDAGTTILSIGMKHEAVGNDDWPFGYSGSIFTPKDDRIHGSPAAWFITRQAGIGGGSGNTGQHQADTSKLIDGVYECRDGQWIRIDN